MNAPAIFEKQNKSRIHFFSFKDKKKAPLGKDAF